MAESDPVATRTSEHARSLGTATGRESSAVSSSSRHVVVLLVLCCLVVFAAHFRPWEVAYLEEWPLARDWDTLGPLGFAANYLHWTLSRPLHLIPTMLGLALGNGWPGMIFLVLAAVAVLQLLAVVWALRPVSRSAWLNIAVGMFLALHPLWPAGYLQRFLPAQTAALGLAFALGMLIRWLVNGRITWLIGGWVTLLAGLATYPGPALVAPLASLVLALAIPASWRRRMVTVVTVTAASALMTFYSLVVTKFISPDAPSYELGNIQHSAVSSVKQLVVLVGGTLRRDGSVVILGIAIVVLLAAILVLAAAIPRWSGALIAVAAIASPATTVVFFGNTGWLSDIDRISYVISLALVPPLMVWPLNRKESRPRLQGALAALLVALSGIGGLFGVLHWQPYIAAQHKLLTALGPIVREAGKDEIVSVVDRSGTLGFFPSFPEQYLGPASVVWNSDNTPVWLCFDASSALPSGASVCESKDTGTTLRLAGSVQLGKGTADIYIGKREKE
ncbi:hypothetical protein [Microbacterium hominis]|uniref:hypothetical protein n=1 Tax=Microbacterium hominis TaxID=162426 RepID=UPI0012E04275|nr:hypothetical protein [Microbacterium hominis]